MDHQPFDEEAIFRIASKIEAIDARTAYLKQVCGKGESMLERVSALLAIHDRRDNFLEEPAAELLPSRPDPITEKPGDRIGSYKLLQQIGEGGFGVVYMAEQTTPVRRMVALKIIKPGMDTKEVIARFEAERQALALMDHPNIAKVYDAGATESGRPYFVMELVKGVPLIEYCDKNHLTGTERLKLFVKVCHAIQHAHQKGVIHRDLKPTNIMVTLHDRKPVPKVIDFGVSKALSQRLTEKTLFTAYGQMVGTPAYMSPEQAEMSGLDIDTRSDIYSLGVLLYELLTGSTPFDRERLQSAGYAEMQRIIREEEPPKPSTRLTTMGDEASVVSSNRGTDPKKLGQLVRGDLDWIVMKALDKERNRRYETANGFAADIERFLADEPVVACPPSAAYRFRKFARRNKAALAITAAALLVLIAIAVGSTIAAKQFRDLAQTNADLAFQKQNALRKAVAAEADAKAAQQEAEDALKLADSNYVLARSAVDEFLNRVTDNQLLSVPGMQSLREELLAAALGFYEDFTQDEANAAELQLELARTYYRIGTIRSELGQSANANTAYEQSIELFERLLQENRENRNLQLGLANVYFKLERYKDVIEMCEEILDENPQDVESRRLLGESFNYLANAKSAQSKINDALIYYRKSLAMRESLVTEFPDNAEYLGNLGSTTNNIGVLLLKQGHDDSALDMYERGVSYSAQAYQKSPQTIVWGRSLCMGLMNMALVQNRLGRTQEALDNYERNVKIRHKLMIENQRIPFLRRELITALRYLGNHQRMMDLTDEANRSYRDIKDLLENFPRRTPEEKAELAFVYGTLAASLEDPAKSTDAQDNSDRQHYAQQAWETIREAIADGYRDTTTLQTHAGLSVLRKRDEFVQLVNELVRAEQADRILARRTTDPETREKELTEVGRMIEDLIGVSSNPLEHQKSLAKIRHAIGLVQIGLEKYDEAEQSLTEAVALWSDLYERESGDSQVAFEWNNSRIALIKVLWITKKYPEAHRLSQDCLEQMTESARTHRNELSVMHEIALQERTISNYYGLCGLYPLAHEHVARSVEFNGVWSAVDNPELPEVAAFACLLLTGTERELARQHLSQLAETFAVQGNRSPFNLGHLIRVAAALNEMDLITDEMLFQFRNISFAERFEVWSSIAEALVQYRASRFIDAQNALERFRGNPRPQLAFLDAAIAARLGETELAQKRWTDGETRFLAACRAAVSREDVDVSAGVVRPLWWEFLFDRAMRAIAAEAMSGSPAPDDPWIHLIQARGYRMIGETDLSEAELAEAASYAGNDARVWLSRAKLLERWGEIERAEADLNKAVALSPEDTDVQTARAEFLAEHQPAEPVDKETETEAEQPNPDGSS